MKAFILVLAIAAVVLAEDDIDWSTVRRRHIRLPLPFGLDLVNFDQRISEGYEPEPNSIPYQAGLLISTSDGIFFCGGSLISTNYVLTAAHCLEGATEVQVRLGAHRIMDNEPTQQRIISTTFTIHTGWNIQILQNDIAVVHLPNPAVLNEYVQLVSMPSYSDVSNNFNGVRGRMSGWGLDSDSATSLSEVLLAVSADIVSLLICNWNFVGLIRDSHICTDGYYGEAACSGDTGGPLVIDGNRQVGIVSFGADICGQRDWPSVCTRLTSFLDWIATNTDVTIEP